MNFLKRKMKMLEISIEKTPYAQVKNDLKI